MNLQEVNAYEQPIIRQRSADISSLSLSRPEIGAEQALERSVEVTSLMKDMRQLSKTAPKVAVGQASAGKLEAAREVLDGAKKTIIAGGGLNEPFDLVPAFYNLAEGYLQAGLPYEGISIFEDIKTRYGYEWYHNLEVPFLADRALGLALAGENEAAHRHFTEAERAAGRHSGWDSARVILAQISAGMLDRALAVANAIEDDYYRALSLGNIEAQKLKLGQPLTLEQTERSLQGSSMIAIPAFYVARAYAEKNHPQEGLEMLVRGEKLYELWDHPEWSHDEACRELAWAFVRSGNYEAAASTVQKMRLAYWGGSEDSAHVTLLLGELDRGDFLSALSMAYQIESGLEQRHIFKEIVIAALKAHNFLAAQEAWGVMADLARTNSPIRVAQRGYLDWLGGLDLEYALAYSGQPQAAWRILDHFEEGQHHQDYFRRELARGLVDYALDWLGAKEKPWFSCCTFLLEPSYGA
jgi:hypothetical protein